ncbi:MAG: amino acid carrier protein [Clostridiales bacterium]|nr:amino acid carrier protein [Clostridiales bacterium]
MTLFEFMSTLDGIVWGRPFTYTLLAAGFIFVFLSRGFVFRHFSHITKNTLGVALSAEGRKSKSGKISPFEAVCVAVGGCVGTGNISGVAAAIAVGGPGAVFWMWLWAFFAMTVKMCEATLGSYYRKKDENGEYVGGSYYYIEEGIGREKKWKVGFVLAWLFSLGFFAMFLSGSQASVLAESLNSSYNVPMIPFVLIYSVFMMYIVWRGVPRIAKMASKAVPVMCAIYLLAGLLIIILNIGNLPSVIVSIFSSAFTGTAAVGGFAGAAVQKAVSQGVARAINSNEAGMGTSPMIHAAADTVHPVRQGLWGAIEVFIDTIIICSITALAILCTGVWTSGSTSMTLALEAFNAAFGGFGTFFLNLMLCLFGLTTTASAFAYYDGALRFMLKRFSKEVVDKCSLLFKLIFPLPNIVIVATIVLSANDYNLYWAFVDVIIALPVFFNVIGLLILSPKFIELIKDYEARYFGKGKVDPDFKIFYETEPNDEAKSLNETFR